jgi:hypothetical protein
MIRDNELNNIRQLYIKFSFSYINAYHLISITFNDIYLLLFS